MTQLARLDRQLRIPEWRQHLLSQTAVGVVGNADSLTSLFVLAAAALGLNELRVVAPQLDSRFTGLAEKVNPDLRLAHFQGYYTHPLCGEVWRGCPLVVDLSRSALTTKLLLEQAFQSDLRVIGCRRWQDADDQGFAIFSYCRGREWLELQELLAPENLPADLEPPDGVLDIIAAGIILEETKKILMDNRLSPDLIRYRCPRTAPLTRQPVIGVVGAGALGNFVGLGLALAGFKDMTCIDPDVIEETNLNRQVLFAGAVGAPKAETLAARLNALFDLQVRAVSAYYRETAQLVSFEVIFDCVDNFATRIRLSEDCATASKILISGGADFRRGQVVAYHPRQQPQTPATLLGLYDIVARRPQESWHRQRASCIYQPDPAVIMANQIVGGFMVEAFRRVWAGGVWPPFFYQADPAPTLSEAD